MKKHAHILSVVISIALATATAHADITVWSGAIYDVVITNPVPVGANPAGENLLGFMLKIVNTTGDPGFNPAGFNGCTPLETKPTDPAAWPWLPTYTGFTTGEARVGAAPDFEVTVYGPDAFHNQYGAWAPTSPTPDEPAFATDVDTHFNFLLADVNWAGSAPSEDNNPVAYPLCLTTNEPSNADPLDPFAFLAANDFGNRLFGHFAVDGGAGADVDGDGDPTVWQLAYFVLPQHMSFYMRPPFAADFFVCGISGGENIFWIPEPATMALLALGACLPLFRRKRR